MDNSAQDESSFLDIEGTDGEDGDGIVTMVDVLKQESDDEADVNAVLGGADDKNCTYSQGYVPRQPLYACRTCCKDSLAGICLACSYKCHEGHDLVELYTKRNFRCDCGNSLFGNAKCTLDPTKAIVNEENAYNQNFSGSYCVCHRPYPDPEDEVEDTMAQCVVCEDWFHARHLEGVEMGKEEGELLCHLCVKKLPFLSLYEELVKNSGTEPNDGKCKIAEKLAVLPENTSAKFWPAGWREKLCKCGSCVELFAKHQVSFLLDDSDSVISFERKNQQRPKESQQEMEMRALSTLDPVQKIEVIQSFNEMKTALMEHLQKFREEDRVVSESDIREFFTEFKAKRRRMMMFPPASCR